MSLLHRRKHDAPPQDTVAPPPAAPAPAPPPSPEEFDAVAAMTHLKDELDDGTITQAEFDARRKQLHPES